MSEANIIFDHPAHNLTVRGFPKVGCLGVELEAIYKLESEGLYAGSLQKAHIK